MNGARPQRGREDSSPLIGVLALQGDVREHAAMLEALGVAVRLVKSPGDLEGVDGLILPGGESTTLQMLLDSSGLRQPLISCLSAGLPALGTCAGMILLATRVLDGRADQSPLGMIDITVRRNVFGRQIDSFEADLPLGSGEIVHAVFIRAPIVEAVGEGVEVLASLDDVSGARCAVICRAGVITVAAFHPELSGDTTLHRHLIDDAKHGVASLAKGGVK